MIGMVVGRGTRLSRLYVTWTHQVQFGTICRIEHDVDFHYDGIYTEGPSIIIGYNTFISNIQTILSSDSQINISRSVSKLKSVLLSLEQDFTGTRKTYYGKQWNNFYSPMAVGTTTITTTHREDFEIESLQLQVGAFLMPQYPIRSHSECYYSLKKSLGMAANSLHGVAIDGNEFRNDKCVLGIDGERHCIHI